MLPASALFSTGVAVANDEPVVPSQRIFCAYGISPLPLFSCHTATAWPLYTSVNPYLNFTFLLKPTGRIILSHALLPSSLSLIATSRLLVSVTRKIGLLSHKESLLKARLVNLVLM